MTMLNKCPKCGNYTMKEECPKDKTKTISAHHKFIKIKDAPKEFRR
jgi:rRNA maturation protein Nop10